jgi:hypothetical protein
MDLLLFALHKMATGIELVKEGCDNPAMRHWHGLLLAGTACWRCNTRKGGRKRVSRESLDLAVNDLYVASSVLHIGFFVSAHRATDELPSNIDCIPALFRMGQAVLTTLLKGLSS